MVSRYSIKATAQTFCFVALFGIVLTACEPAANAIKTPVNVTKFDFGIINPSGEMVTASKIPYTWGENYGWVMNVDPRDKMLHWKEELRKPSVQSKNDPTAKNESVLVVLEKDEMPKDGVVSNVYAIAPGDPKGAYSMTLSVNGRAVKTIDFQIN